MFRDATSADAEALRDLERAANLVALAHVFPSGEHPYPDAEVLARWQRVLADASMTTLVEEDAAGLTVLAAFDAQRLHHLAVRPDCWGGGLARRAVEASSAELLWCLADNDRARGLYEHLGWRTTGVVRAAEWPPFPRELEYRRGA